MNRVKRILAVLLALVLLCQCAPMSVFAEGADLIAAESGISVSPSDAEGEETDAPQEEAIPEEDISEEEIPEEELLEEEEEVLEEENKCGENVTWTLSGGVLTVSGEGAMDDYTTNTSEIPWSESLSEITAVVIESGVTTIGNYAFNYATNLTSVTVADSVTSIGTNAFRNCTSLSNLQIGSGVTTIGSSAFESCNSLTAVTLPDNVASLGGSAFARCMGLTEITLGRGLQSIGSYAFQYCTGLVSVNFSGSNLRTVGDYAFYYCGEITSLYIPEGVTSIGAGAFHFCDAMTYIELPETLVSIGNEAFRHCDALTYIIIPGVDTIGEYAFYSCDKLDQVTLDKNIKNIGKGAFGSTYLLKTVVYTGSEEDWANMNIAEDNSYLLNATKYYDRTRDLYRGEIGDLMWRIDSNYSLILNGDCDMPDFSGPAAAPWYPYRDIIKHIEVSPDVYTVGDYAFAYLGNATSVYIGGYVDSIGDYAFYYCGGLTEIELPEDLKTIGKGAFHYCDGLTSINLHDGITSIGQEAFRHCEGLTSVTIPAGVTNLEDYVFYSCDNLATVYFENTIESIGLGSFVADYNLKNIYFNGTEEEWAKVVIGNNNDYFTAATVHFNAAKPVASGKCGPNVIWNLDSNGVLTLSGTGATYDYTSSGYDRPWYDYFNQITAVVIGDGITSIGDYLFAYCQQITSAVIGKDVETIGDNAFYVNSALKDLDIQSKKITEIGDFAFFNCSSLPAIIIPDSVETVDNYAFAQCGSATEVIGGAGVVNYGEYVFSYCTALTEITLGNNVKTLGDYLFNYCTALAEINLPDGLTTIGEGVFYYTPITEIDLPDSLTELGSNVFHYCNKLESIKFPSGLTEIKSRTIHGGESLKSLYIPKSVTSIGEDMVTICRTITDIYYEGTETDWSKLAMNDETQYSLANATVHFGLYETRSGRCGDSATWTLTPDGTLTISGEGETYDYPYGNDRPWGQYINQITAVVVEDGITSIGAYLFAYCQQITSAVIGKDVEYIGDNSFYVNSALTDLDIQSEKITKIGDFAFFNCSSLPAIIIPDSVETVDNYAFAQCSSATEVIGGAGVVNYGEYVFSYCGALTEITLGDKVDVLGGYLFNYCDNLAEINLPDSITTIGDGVFYYTPITEIDLPANLKSLGTNVFHYCNKLESIKFPSGLSEIKSGTIHGGDSLKTLYIPKSVTNIAEDAVIICRTITDVYYEGRWTEWDDIVAEPNSAILNAEIHYGYPYDTVSGTFGENVTWTMDVEGNLVISGSGPMYFYEEYEMAPPWITHGEYITSVVIEDGVTSVYQSAFYGLVNLKTAVIGKDVEIMEQNAFQNCINLERVEINSEKLTTIPSNTFADCSSLKEITIPVNVTTIDSYAFDGCTSFGDIYYGGTLDDWNIAIYEGNECFLNGRIYYTAPEKDYPFKADLASPQPIGTAITLSAEANDGYTYKFYYDGVGKWVSIQNFSASNTCTWTPTEARDYVLYAEVKDASGTLVDTFRINYTVTDPYVFTASPESVQNVGSAVELSAEGGSNYKFYYLYNGTWTKIQDSAESTCTWTPNIAGDYLLYVDIKDENGKIITCRAMDFKVEDTAEFTASAYGTVNAGEEISFTAAGGSSYKFYYEQNGKWVKVQDGAESTCTWTPADAGSYKFYVDIKNAEGKVMFCRRICYDVVDPYTFTADVESPQAVGATIRLTANGGDTYKFYYELGGAWVRIKNFSTANTCTWIPKAAGDYELYVDIKDANGVQVARKSLNMVVGTPEAVNDGFTFTADAVSPQNVGAAIKLTATGGATYKFYYDNNGKWVSIQNFSASNTCTWTPTVARSYNLYVDIKDASGTLVACRRMAYTIADPYSFSADPASTQAIGETVSLTAAGGSSYKFYYEFGGKWTKIQDSASSTCTWTPKQAGDYLLYVDIKDASGKVLTCRSIEYTVSDPFAFTADAASPQNINSAVKLTANGGSSYKFYYEQSGKWTRIQDYSAANTCTWTPTKAGVYNLYVDIKDANGKLVSCRRMSFVIADPYSISIDADSPVELGESVKISAEGGYTYKFYYELGGAWVRIKNFSTADTCTWTPKEAGDYMLYVDIKDENGVQVARKGINLVVE